MRTSHRRAHRAEYLPAGFFVLRTPLLPLDMFENWTGKARAAADTGGVPTSFRNREHHLRQGLREALRDARVREALRLASPSLYQRMSYWENDPSSEKGRKVEIALVKYFTCMCSRSTPFGLFAGVSTGSVANGTRLRLDHPRSYRRHARLDSGFACLLAEHLLKDGITREQLRFFPNDSIYRIGESYRFVEYDNVEGPRRYRLSAVESSPALAGALSRSAHGVTLPDLSTYIARSQDVDREEAMAFVAAMADRKLLISELEPEITGDDAFDAMVASLSRLEHKSAAVGAAISAHRKMLDLNGKEIGIAGTEYDAILADFRRAGLPGDIAEVLQVDMFKPSDALHIDEKLVREIEYCARLVYGATARPANALDDFIGRFVARYDRQRVPLVDVLDDKPWVGVTYLFSNHSIPEEGSMRLRLARRFPRTSVIVRRWSTVVLALSVIAACSTLQWRPDSMATAPVIEGFGVGGMQPSKADEAARRLFAQGMAQVYAFNEVEAIRSFKAALAQDPDCALCAWGVAYQMGPNINDSERHDLREAVRYVDYAVKHSAGSSEHDRALIDALAVRYGTNPGARATAVIQGEICGVAGKRRADPLDIAYAERMRQLVARFPGDPDILSIYAEAELVATRADWRDRRTGLPAGRVGELADMLEQGLMLHPQHIGLNHYMIHTVDAVPVARRAEASADRLGALAPKSPHLLHMPSHTYAHLGRYADATRVNQAAVAADEAMALELKRQNFTVSKDWRGHNLHFLWYAALMEGRSELALSTARALALRAKGDNTYAEYLRSLPMLTLLRLQRWDELRQEPLPSGEKGVATVMGQMASGIALTHAGERSAAQAAQARLDSAADKLAKEHPSQGNVDKLLRSMARSAQAQLRAEIAWSGQHTDEALAQQQLAVTASYDADGTEPPTLASGPRLRLGAMQLQARRYNAAEQSFRAHLAEHPGNGWALQGLRQALAAQGKQAEAQATGRELERNWKQADIGLRSAGR